MYKGKKSFWSKKVLEWTLPRTHRQKMCKGHWCRRRGCNLTPKSFDLVKIQAKSHKIQATSLRTFWNSLKIWAKMALHMLWFENGARIDMKSLFLEITWCPIWFFAQVWENPGKIPSHPQKFACSDKDVQREC